MKWRKYEMAIKDIPNLVKQIDISIKNGDPVLEYLRCVYIMEDDNLIHYLTPFDFLDNFNENLKIKAFATYQVLEI